MYFPLDKIRRRVGIWIVELLCFDRHRRGCMRLFSHLAQLYSITFIHRLHKEEQRTELVKPGAHFGVDLIRQ